MESGIRTKADIFQRIREHEEAIRSLGVRRLGLFGSFVRGEQRLDSDVDFLVDFDPLGKTFDHFMELSFLLEEALQRRVELVTPESLSPYLGPEILSEVEYASLGA
jgi:predicted nucleotidyltransferase